MRNKAEKGVRFSAEVLEAFLREIYDGFDVSDDIEPTAWREALRLLNEATVEGITRSKADTHDKRFLRNLRHSNEVFTAFKVHSMGVTMAERLYDGKGNLRSFADFKKAVAPIASHQVGSWLRTEYNTAVRRAHLAADWQEFEQNRDIFPNLRWMPTTSPNAEGSHRVYWERKLTLPVNDSFWAKHHPGDRWNCKCSLEATDAPVTEDFSETDAPAPQRGLNVNPKDGQIFSDKHPYFPAKCSKCWAYKQAKGVRNTLRKFFENKEKDCYNCPYVDGCVEKIKKINQKEAIGHIKEIKKTIPTHDGILLENKMFQTGQLRILRRSLQDIFEHNLEDENFVRWLRSFDFSDIKDWEYAGWAENRPYDSTHSKYDPMNPNKKKHPETEYFLYYKLNINGETYWANVKMHNYFNGEVLYTIEKERPNDLIEGVRLKNKKE